ncbi:MAG: hypothetical protein AB1679_18735 [Actinomycetota bacterium]
MTPGLRTTFGVVTRRAPAGAADLALEGWALIEPEVRSLAARVLRDIAVAHASGRWRPGQPDPRSYLPGDVLALRALPVVTDFEYLNHYRGVLTDPRAGRAARVEAACRTGTILDDARVIYEAVPHFLDAEVAAGILASHPPGPDVLAEVRLPHRRIAVFLSEILEVPPDSCDWPPAWDHTADLEGRATTQRTILGELRARGGGIEGVVVTEVPGGGLSDDVLWLLSAEPDRDGPGQLAHDRLRSEVWGRRSLAHLAPVAENLAAAVAWGEWREARPVDLPDDPRSKAWRKAVRRGEFRRREPHGGAGGVRVLDLRRSPVVDHRSAAPNITGGGRASPVTHLRRAHWRLQPVGHNGTQRRLTRVSATVVRPGATPTRTTVYRIPAPDSDAAEPDPEPHRAHPTEAVDFRSIDLPLNAAPRSEAVDLRNVDVPLDPAPEPAPRRTGIEIEP